MQLKISKFFILVFVFVFLLGLLPTTIFAEENLADSKVIITEIRLGGSSIELGTTTYKEYVTLFNVSGEEIDLQNWSIEYAKNDFNETSCGIPFWSDTVDGFSTSLEGLILPSNGILSIERQLNDTGSGSLRVIEDIGDTVVVHDLVGWGANAPCAEDTPAISPSAGASIKRYIDCETNLSVDTNSNLVDFALSEDPKPTELSGPLINCPDSDLEDDEDNTGGDTGDMVQNSCAGIVITEILPNPSGVDTGNEFIELYNPTAEAISLEGCKLETTANTNIYTFGDIELVSKQYMAFYDDITGLTLANSSGGSVYLVDTDNSEQEVEYGASLDDNVAWAVKLASGDWSITYSATPAGQNKIVEVKPCPKGQFRNLKTNRCNKIAIELGLGSCPAGKFRNPETNRCKSLLDASSQLKPCNPGQFRNPETNRCKSLSSGRSLVPCNPDQERNPETNRCRKKTSTSQESSNQVKDVLSVSQTDNQTSWLMAGFTFAGASAYAIWEWRNEMLEKLLALKNKLSLK